ncbi:uncharacterized protein LOC121514686 [Cheilinus undulatus]|uniref:uncharacterized protein LOC121514686 n=1 Tax=Cheilinus undulatus TaxID=241271 RepID=UPI001BD37697|nr:uncharacterized protein LOC121514686 [Cheilinus undulatus]
MEEELPPVNTCLQSFPKLPLWIIEHVWAHNVMDLQEVVSSSKWPEMDSQPLTLEDSWRLRVTSAQVYFIMKKRDMEQSERVMEFLEATYKILPRLVPPIKHMKIMFGLKTMVVMQMLREGRGMVDTVFKINQYFPSKLPQYQDQCSQHQMFLMRRNNLEFKTFAQELAMDKDKLKDYAKNQMEEEYGESYAQKVEDRLLHYLHRLDTVLPGDTYIDKVQKKQSPVSEEEKLLLEIISSDTATIATTLRKLLQCDVASCCPDDNDPDLRRHHQSKGNGEASPSPQFCSKHQRWVRNILQHCPDECSEEMRLQANVSSSPTLFHSSSSGSSSGDLTPSGLIPLPSNGQHPPSQTSTHLQTAALLSEPANSNKQISGSTVTSGTESQNVSGNALQQQLLSPVVQLVDIASIPGFLSIFKSQQVPPNHNLQETSNASPHIRSSGDVAIYQETMKDTSFSQPGALKSPPYSANEASISSDLANVIFCQPETRRHSFRPFRKCRLAGSQPLGSISRNPSAQTTFRNSCPLLPEYHNNSKSSSQDCPSTSSQSGTQSSSSPAYKTPLSSDSSQEVSTENTLTSHRLSQSLTIISSSSDSRCLSVRSDTSQVQTASLRLSLRSQAVLLQSKLLQPCVSLVRLSRQECYGGTVWRSSPTHLQPEGQDSSGDSSQESRMEDSEDEDPSFDVNVLFSSFSSSSDSENPLDCDPDYKPWIKKKRLLLEYESARVINQT